MSFKVTAFVFSSLFLSAAGVGGTFIYKYLTKTSTDAEQKENSNSQEEHEGPNKDEKNKEEPPEHNLGTKRKKDGRKQKGSRVRNKKDKKIEKRT